MSYYFIIATNPYYFSWNLEGACCHDSLAMFKFINGQIISNTGKYLCINESEHVVYFADEQLQSCPQSCPKFELINSRKNVFKIKEITTGRFIRHYNSQLKLDHNNNTPLFDADSNWILFRPAPANYIIARYNEDIRWTRYLQYYNNNVDDDRAVVFIYNKGLPNITSHNQIINLPNIGREGHTYLYHIVNNYNSPAKKSVFLQGDPFPHSPFIMELLCDNNQYNESDKYNESTRYTGLSLWYSKTWPAPEITQRFIKSNKTTTYVLNDSLEYVGFKTKYYLVGSKVRDNPQIICDFMKRHDINKHRQGFLVNLAGLFIINSIAITAKPLPFWEKLLESSSANKLNGYILEFLWPTIFEDDNSLFQN